MPCQKPETDTSLNLFVASETSMRRFCVLKSVDMPLGMRLHEKIFESNGQPILISQSFSSC